MAKKIIQADRNCERLTVQYNEEDDLITLWQTGSLVITREQSIRLVETLRMVLRNDPETGNG